METETEILKMRLMAYIVDFFLMFFFYAISLIPVMIFLSLIIYSESDLVNIFNMITFYGIYFFTVAYFTVNEAMISTTLGKRICDLKTIEYLNSDEYSDDEESKITWKQAFIRSLLKIRPEILIFDVLIGFYVKYGKFQRTSESISNTKVIYADFISGFTKQRQKVFRVYRKVFFILGILIMLLLVFTDILFLIDILIPLIF